MMEAFGEFGGKIPLLDRWTTDFDCEYETNWWYVIKDTPFDISLLKSKRRCVINKGKKCFDVCRIDPQLYKEELYNITIEAYKSYPKKYRPNVNHDDFILSIENWKDIVYGAFFRETKHLCGYALLSEKKDYMGLSVVKTIPEFERFQINAAIVYQILEDQQNFCQMDIFVMVAETLVMKHCIKIILKNILAFERLIVSFI